MLIGLDGIWIVSERTISLDSSGSAFAVDRVPIGPIIYELLIYVAWFKGSDIEFVIIEYSAWTAELNEQKPEIFLP